MLWVTVDAVHTCPALPDAQGVCGHGSEGALLDAHGVRGHTRRQVS
nr:MAG TPA: hypothetical protein [Caudoviricetes sp.]